ncbi:MAG: hypothetical protein AAFP81_06230 [Pseudomonadota bacterium]
MTSERIYKYRVYGLTIAAEFEIKELKPCDIDDAVDVTIKFSELGLLSSNAHPRFEFSEKKQTIVLPVVGAFIIEGSDTVLVERAAGVSDDFLAVPLLGPVLAILLHLREMFILHGSAVAIDGKAYGFVGDKGAGKSTLAAMLLKNPDVEFITDDLLVLSVDRQVLRGYPQMKLSEEALQNSKQELGRVRQPPIDRFPKHQFLLDQQLPDEALPIGAIFELRRSSCAKINSLSLQESIRVLLRFSYMARFIDREISSLEKSNLLKFTSQIAMSGNVSRLFVPSEISELDKLVSTIQAN